MSSPRSLSSKAQTLVYCSRERDRPLFKESPPLDMEISMKPPSIRLPCQSHRRIFTIRTGGGDTIKNFHPSPPLNRSVVRFHSVRVKSSSMGDLQRCKCQLESLFCYDKSIPEEKIEKPIGLWLNKKEIGNKPPCIDCEAKGAVLCTTCSGSGLYVESILESQGVIVKVRCIGCGGIGNIMCSGCGGRGHHGTN